MKLRWEKDPERKYGYTAETIRYRFIMIVEPRERTALWVQHVRDDWATKPIDQRECRSRYAAERMAQRFEDKPYARRLR